PEGEAYARRSYEAPQGEVEQALAAIWTELLGLEQVSRHDHFFELGGHSLLAMRLLSRLKDEIVFSIELSTIFKNPTLSDLARELIIIFLSKNINQRKTPSVDLVSEE
ncbi:phosphopantetheine-binding protein, partial [Rhizobium rhizogenes]|uniref:phosphopantetheine-binding protein n=1 Tax=Rhizobium rhizogenes TaxID=359 RepID=UPI00115C4DF6